MKHKNPMIKLRNRIVIYFLVITLCTGIISSASEELVNIVYSLAPQFWENHLNISTAFLTAYILLDAALYVAGGFVFYRLTKKAIQKESERRIKEQNLLYAAIAHDLKTPMTSVQGFAKALSDGRIPPDEQQETYDIIYRKSQSMNELINTLFEYSKFGTEEYTLNKSEFDLCALVRDIIAENYCEMEEHGIEPELDIPDDAVNITADKQELRRALTNLAVNTYKHNPDGISVFVQVKAENNSCIVTIADSGNDIPQDMDIFEPFVTENSARTIGHGTGLGLAITKRIIERHSGTIEISHDVSGYTKAFVVKLRTDSTQVK